MYYCTHISDTKTRLDINLSAKSKKVESDKLLYLFKGNILYVQLKFLDTFAYAFIM